MFKKNKKTQKKEKSKDKDKEREKDKSSSKKSSPVDYLPGRVAHTFQLLGPSLTIDNGCSSFLTAIDLAAQQLVLKRTEYALIVTGYMLHPASSSVIAQMNLTSKTGTSASFQKAADGYVLAEGGAALLLTLPSTAQKNNMTIHANVCSTFVNGNGPRWNMFFPHRKQMEECLYSALDYAALKPYEVDMLELQGTSTNMADEVEHGAVSSVFSAYDDDPPRKQELVIGVHTPNVGHLLIADAAISFIKAVLAIQHKECPPNLINPGELAFTFSSLPAKFSEQSIKFGKQTLKVLVNSFSATGSNSAVIVESVGGDPSLTSRQFDWEKASK